MFSLAACGALLLCAGCASLPSGRGWGEGATARPGWDRVRGAAKDAATDPWVWVPLAGAAVFQVGDLDRRTSDWAREETPLFGSRQAAVDWSNYLRSTSAVLQFATLLATPSGSEADEWIANKAKGAAVELAAIGATSLATVSLKSATDRLRPSGSNRESFPSGHASSSAVSGRLAAINLDEVEMNAGARRSAEIGIDAVVIGTGWARVEAGAHYPSDVLVGMALGNFFARFATEAFLDPRARESISVAATDGGALLDLNFRF